MRSTLHDWFLWNELALNPDKAEVTVLESDAKLRYLDSMSTVSIAGVTVQLVDTFKSQSSLRDVSDHAPAIRLLNFDTMTRYKFVYLR